ncbi:MAG: hypothetical protein JSV31_16600 [Desulfobacterales bacterium]|nr:MAG: hypothetical protein JSV31_16600 [Desulfobacterales bacterium]
MDTSKHYFEHGGINRGAVRTAAQFNIPANRMAGVAFFQIKTSPKGKPLIIGQRQATVFDDLLFHATHAGRHLGMIEALRGTLFSIAGTASV